jgi:hypothetical protein
MKIRTLLIGFLCVAAPASAATLSLDQIQQMEITRTQAMLSLINWKVGDLQDYKVTLGMGLDGTMHKEVTKDEGSSAVWIKQELKLPIMNDTSEVLYDRNTGKVLKYVHNGKEESLPDDKIEIVSTKNDVVEVPAGKFKVLHVVAKSEKVKQIEIWMNPREISMDGAAKLYMDQGMIKITMELTKFVKQ